MRMASIASMSVASLLILAKAAAWLATDSVAMLSSLVDSALDLVSSLITFAAIHQAIQPADAEHRFGHGKAEALSGIAQAGFIAASAGGLILTVVDRYLHPRALQAEMADDVRRLGALLDRDLSGWLTSGDESGPMDGRQAGGTEGHGRQAGGTEGHGRQAGGTEGHGRQAGEVDGPGPRVDGNEWDGS